MKKIKIDSTEASSVSRILQHLDKPNLGVVSAFLDSEDLSPKEQQKLNNSNTNKLKKEVRSLGYDFIVLDSKWEEDGEVSSELSLFVPNLPFKEAVKLGKKYGQRSVLDKTDDGKFAWVGSRKDSGVGKILQVFSKSEISESQFKGAFSQLLKGSQRNKKIKFSSINEMTRVPLQLRTWT